MLECPPVVIRIGWNWNAFRMGVWLIVLLELTASFFFAEEEEEDEGNCDGEEDDWCEVLTVWELLVLLTPPLPVSVPSASFFCLGRWWLL